MKKEIGKISLVILFAWTGLFVFRAGAAVPGRIPYQGKLSGPDGQLIDGERRVDFSFFTGETGGEPVWTEIHDRVQVTRGIFSVILGSESDLSEIFQSYDELWFEISVDEETLQSRQLMGSVGYSIRTSGINVTPEGRVGIGTSSPEGKLQVEGTVISKVEGKTYRMIPRGGILMWSRPLDMIPPGWQLCDGTNGTPDFRDRFLYGVSSGQDPGVTGGAASHTHTFHDTVSRYTSSGGAHTHTYTQIPSHSHTISPPTSTSSSSGGHNHSFNPPSTTTSSAGSHSHTVPARASSGGFGSRAAARGWSAGGHTTGTSTSGSHTHSVSVPQTTSSQRSAHTHSVSFSSFNTGYTGDSSPSTHSAGGHTHELADYTAEGTTGSASNLPPYVKLVFIIRVD